MIGRTIGSYEIVDKLGEGGMGGVYRARDATLQRDVAIKVLTGAFASDADRLARFRREAQALAALNHPNIAQIYGFEGTALVMEFVDGEDLAARLSRGPLAIDDAMLVARRIAEGLEYAHERGIIHRDLKPANIKIAGNGQVKILDFGLAKAIDRDPSSSNAMNSPTLTARATEAGMILGTAAYMSPEQARGKTVDKRTDIWAFGAVLFEMLAGRRAFDGETVSDMLAAVLRSDPDWSHLPSGTPAHVRALLRRCLDRDVAQRLRDIGEARVWLGTPDLLLPLEVDRGSAPPAPRSTWRRVAALATIVGTAALTAAIAWQLRAPLDPPVRRFMIRAPADAAPSIAAISPDGATLAIIASDKIWLQRLDAFGPSEVPGSNGAHVVFWSPDGAFLGFQARGQLWKAPTTGGAPIAIGRVSSEFTVVGGAAWLEDGRIIFTTGSTGLLQMPAEGGEITSFLDIDPTKDTDFHTLAALPGGRGLLFVTHASNSADWPIEVYSLAERSRTVLVNGRGLSSPWYSPTGHILFEQAAGVWALPFSLTRMRADGSAFLVADDARRPTVSADGTLVMLPGSGFTGDLRLFSFDRSGQFGTQIGQVTAITAGPRISPDGRFVAAMVGEADDSDVWIFDIARGTDRRLTFESGLDGVPRWTRDGRFVVYQCGTAACARRADGSGGRIELLQEAGAPVVSPDGKFLVFLRESTPGDSDVWLVELGAAGVSSPTTAEPRVFIAAPLAQRQVDISPDSRYAVYSSLEAGMWTIYVTRFPVADGKWEVSRGWGVMPRWGAKGDRLYFADDLYRIVEMEVDLETTFNPGPPDLRMPNVFAWGGFDVSPDGQWFAVPRSPTGSGQTGNVLIVQHWFQPPRK
jgi:serine/threonine-protein kinase